MFVRYRKLENERTRVQIVENYRVGERITQKVLRHVGTAHTEAELEQLKNMAEYIKETLESELRPSLFSKEELEKTKVKSRLAQTEAELPTLVNLHNLREEQRITTGFHEVYGRLFDQVGYGTILNSGKVSNSIFKDVVMARLAKPVSKRATCELLSEHFGIDHELVQIYRMMDAIKSDRKNAKGEIVHVDRIQAIQDITYGYSKQLLQKKITIFFYDVTTLYFESFTEDELRRFGYSKDHKFNQGQIVLALMVAEGGLPVGYDVFPGNMYEGATFQLAIDKLKTTYSQDEAIIVADSGLMSEANINIVKKSGFQYILGARLKNLTQQWQETILSNTDYDDTRVIYYKDQVEKEKDILQIKDYDYMHEDPQEKKKKRKKKEEEGAENEMESSKKERLIVSRSSARAKKDQFDREKALSRLILKIKKSKNPVDLISNYGYKKYIQIDGESSISVNKEKIAQAVLWDGLHGVFTNTKREEVNPYTVLSEYHGLWQVEDSFRINKHDLRMRPVFHWTPDRIKSHIAICFVAFSLIRFLQYQLKTEVDERFSALRISMELNSVQESILYDVNNRSQKYVIPSKSSENVTKIYQAMKLHRNVVPYKLKE